MKFPLVNMSFMKKSMWISLLVLAILLVFSVSMLRAFGSHKLQEELFQNPSDVPAWITAIGPQPGSIIPIEEASYGESHPFSPAFGTLCVQLDNNELDLATPFSYRQMTFEVDGFRTYEPRRGFLMHGFIPKKGIQLMFPSMKDPSLINHCLAMHLKAGKHIARFEIPAEDKSYSWAFMLTE